MPMVLIWLHKVFYAAHGYDISQSQSWLRLAGVPSRVRTDGQRNMQPPRNPRAEARAVSVARTHARRCTDAIDVWCHAK